MNIISYKQAADLQAAVHAHLFISEDDLRCPKAIEAQQALQVKNGKTGLFTYMEGGALHTVVLCRLEEPLSYDAVEEALADLFDKVKALNQNAASLSLPVSLKDHTAQIYKQALLSADAFDAYMTTGLHAHDGKEEKHQSKAVDYTVVLSEGFDEEREGLLFARARQTADAIALARRLVNEPANVMSPARLAQEAQQAGQKAGFSVKVYDETEIQAMGLQAFYSVAKGSDTPPRFIVMEYKNAPNDSRLLALVGKGLTYDAGGYALKPAQGMDTMYCDMGGSAAVIGAMTLLAAAKARVNVVAVVAACENMISGHAYRNGDIIPSLSGKYIEVVNTDAEGRLTLADAITYAATALKADAIIDIATLTGACGVALGDYTTALVSDSDELSARLADASHRCGDKIWRMPHDDSFAKLNKSDRADIKNSGGRKGGTVSAGLFLRAFAAGKPWAHLDIAATAFHDFVCAKSPKGGTGVGVELLALAAENMFK